MVLIFVLYCIYGLVFTAIGKLFFPETKIVDALFIGLIVLSIYGYVFSYFDGIRNVFFLFSAAVLITLGILRLRLKPVISSIRNKINIGSVIWTILVLAYTALPSNYLDDGLYYSQSIRWFEEYGIVKGLANLDINLGQASLLHLISAITNFSTLGFRFNDFSGFLLWIIGLEVWKNRLAIEKFKFFTYSLLLIFSLSLINAENTDVCLIVIFLKITLLDKQDKDLTRDFLLIGLIAFAIGVKASALPIAILLLLDYNWKISIKPRIALFFLLPIGFLFFKSWYLTGYPFFPFYSWLATNVSWQLPEQFFVFGKLAAKYSAYIVTVEQFEHFRTLDFSEKLALFFNLTHWRGIFRVMFSVLLFIALVELIRTRIIDPLFIIIFVFSIIYLLTSPQPRIALPYMTLLLLHISQLGLFRIFPSKIQQNLLSFNTRIPLAILTLAAVCMLFIPWNFLNRWFRSDIASYRNFSIEYIISPHPTWNNIEVVKKSINGIDFWQPLRRDLSCFDSRFPCLVMPIQDFLHKQYYYAPRLLNRTIKSGFAYEKVKIKETDINNWNSFSHKLRLVDK